MHDGRSSSEACGGEGESPGDCVRAAHGARPVGVDLLLPAIVYGRPSGEAVRGEPAHLCVYICSAAQPCSVEWMPFVVGLEAMRCRACAVLSLVQPCGAEPCHLSLMQPRSVTSARSFAFDAALATRFVEIGAAVECAERAKFCLRCCAQRLPLVSLKSLQL